MTTTPNPDDQPVDADAVPARRPIRKPVQPRRNLGNVTAPRAVSPATGPRGCTAGCSSSTSSPPDKSLENQIKLIQDRISQVLLGHSTGVYLYGAGGLGKSHIALEVFQKYAFNPIIINTQLTPKGMFEALKSAPEGIFLIEDAEQFFDNKVSSGLLRSALWSQEQRNEVGRQPRRVTWHTAKTQDAIVFTGGLVVCSNRPLPNTPEMDAVKTRIAYLEFKMTQEQVISKMREISGCGYADGGLQLEAEKCLEVCEFVISEATSNGRDLNLRMLFNAFRDRCSFESGKIVTSWKDMVASALTQHAANLMHPLSRAERFERDMNLLKNWAATVDDKPALIRMAKERGFERSYAYRRVNDLIELYPNLWLES